MADQHQAWLENSGSDVLHVRTAWSLPERTSKDRRCRDRPALLRAGDVLTPGYTRRTVHHGGTDGYQGVGQRFGLCKGQEPGRASLGPVLDGATKP
mgnify:CR=1 FL=1